MSTSTPDFTLEVEGVKGLCPPGEAWAKQHMAEKHIPVLSCEGPCVRGDIARLAANKVAEEAPYARCCYQEALCVPHSAMARWLKTADQVVMIDGCFLTCAGRVLKKSIDEAHMIHFDILPMYNKYTSVFAMEDVPEAERALVAREVADQILARLKEETAV